ncbi:Uncharacterised protein [Segatella copri]|nr:Uncharacterised protein [Segatella copri]
MHFSWTPTNFTNFFVEHFLHYFLTRNVHRQWYKRSFLLHFLDYFFRTSSLQIIIL